MAKKRVNAGKRVPYKFALNQDTVIGRSRFQTVADVKTTFNSGYIVPIKLWEVLPGDTLKVKLNQLTRLWTTVTPFMDNVTMDVFFFYVPNRIVWQNWTAFLGDHENDDGSFLPSEYVVPTISGSLGADYIGSIYDMYGVPVFAGAGQTTSTDGEAMTYGNNVPCNALPFRGYNLIYNEWFRPEWIIDPVSVPLGDGADNISNYKLLRRAKRNDAYTGALPFPQAGPAVELDLASTANLNVNSGATIGLSGYNIVGSGTNASKSPTIGAFVGNGAKTSGFFGDSSNEWNSGYGFTLSSSSVGNISVPVSSISGITADLTQATGLTVNTLRQMFQLQRFYEKLARGGKRYTEIIRSFFGVSTGDARLQRPEFLGGGSIVLHQNPVAQTSQTTSDSALGDLAAFSVFSGNSGGFSRSFVEHGFVHCLISVRADKTYQQGLPKIFSRRHWTDYYFPQFAHLGEEPVKNQELFVTNNQEQNEGVFGYQERYYDYRYDMSEIKGVFRSTVYGGMDAWHLAQYFETLPTLSEDFINENPPLDRVIALDSSDIKTPQFFGDFLFHVDFVRPIPVYGTPGLVDHM